MQKFERIGARIRRRTRISGLLGAGIGYSLALTPSLLPRPALLMGLVAGVGAGIGYGVGIGIYKLWRWFSGHDVSVATRDAVWPIVVRSGVVLLIAMAFVGGIWQNNVRTLVDQPVLQEYHLLMIIVVSILFALLSVAIGKGVRNLYGVVRRRITQWLPRTLGVATAVVVVAACLWVLINGLFLNGFLAVADAIFKPVNDNTDPGVVQTTSGLRSGGEDSLVSWDSLGKMGRRFVAGGPSQETITAWSGQPAKEQIRVYAGLEAADDAESRAEIVLNELKRTNAFDRKYLVVVTPTGTGWIEPQTADAVAYLTNGDSAMAAIQYSYLPSWISFLVDQQRAREAGKALYDTIYDYWATLPENDRPQIVSFGLSLGSFGGQAAFSGVSDMRARTEGVLFVGTPNFTEPWQTITADRDAGSPEVKPVYEKGATVRFAANKNDLTTKLDSWRQPRVLYMQHGSDPIVWFNFNLIYKMPDWLREPPAPDVTGDMRWMPFVTFLQVTIDQIYGVQVPNGFGHNYSNNNVYAWKAVLRDLPWSDSQYADLQHKIATQPLE